MVQFNGNIGDRYFTRSIYWANGLGRYGLYSEKQMSFSLFTRNKTPKRDMARWEYWCLVWGVTIQCLVLILVFLSILL